MRRGSTSSRELLRIRHEAIVPAARRRSRRRGERDAARRYGASGRLDAGRPVPLTLIANLADPASDVAPADAIAGDLLYASPSDVPDELRQGRLPPWSVLWLLNQHAS